MDAAEVKRHPPHKIYRSAMELCLNWLERECPEHDLSGKEEARKALAWIVSREIESNSDSLLAAAKAILEAK